MKKKKVRSPISAGRAAQRKIEKALWEVEELLDDERWDEAVKLLEPLAERHPHHVGVATQLAYAYSQAGDYHAYLLAMRRLHRLTPQEPINALALAGAYALNVRSVLALRTFKSFLERWPEHPDAAKARKSVEDLEPLLRESLEKSGLTGEDGFEMAALHEESQLLIEQGDYDEARALVEQALKRKPDFVSARNNLSQIDYLLGRTSEAVAAAQQVLERDPQNFHALSNLTRYLVLLGRRDEARQYAERLKPLESDRIELRIKQAEAFTFLGDDAAVLEVLREAEQEPLLDQIPEASFLFHLAGCAALRLGQEGRARECWKRALRLSPGFEPARANLADLSKPVHERHAPWALPLSYWVTQKTINEMHAHIGASVGEGDEAVSRAAQQFLDQHPEMVRLLPTLLERGGPDSRRFVIQLIGLTEKPELLTLLRDFALGQQGPDATRFEAATACAEAGLLPAGTIRMWMRGKWSETLLLGFELTGEPIDRGHSREVRRLVKQGLDATHEQRYAAAVQLFRRALELEPGAPDLKMNLAATLSMQGFTDEAEQLTEEVYRLHPDYLFARTNMVVQLVEQGKLEEAEKLIEPLMSRKKFHLSEFGALCNAQIEISLARKQHDAARSWFEMWEGADPDAPQLDRVRARVAKHDWRQLLKWK